MKEKIIRILTVVLGIWLGIIASLMLKRSIEIGFLWYIGLITISIILTLAFEKEFFKTIPSKVIGLFIGFALSYPIGNIIQYIVILVISLLKGVIFILRIPFIGYVVGVILIALIGYVIYFVATNAKYYKKDKKEDKK